MKDRKEKIISSAPAQEGGRRRPALHLEKSRRQTKRGSYSIALIAFVIAAVIAINLIVAELPSKYRQIDMTSQQLSELTDESRKVLSGVTKDMTIYLIAQDDKRDDNIYRLLERYADASSHIKIEVKDPVVNPKFTSQYTDEDVDENSVIVVCGDQSRVIAYSDLYESQFDMSTYSNQQTGFDAEGQITSAIAAFNSGSSSKLYTLSGHGEEDLPDSLTSAIEKENIETGSLNLINEEIPDDADVLLITMPTTDLSEAETAKIRTYLQGGGRAIFISGYTKKEMPNYDSLLEYVGVKPVPGVVMEGNSQNYVQYPYYLIPTINDTDVTQGMSGGKAYVLMVAAQGLQKVDNSESGLTVNSVLTTSDSAYSKTNVASMTTYDKEDGDTDGPFDVAVIASGVISGDSQKQEEITADSASQLTTAAAEETGAAADAASAETTAAAGTTAASDTTKAAGTTASADTTAAANVTTAETDGTQSAEETAAAESSAEGTSDEKSSDSRETRVAVFSSATILDENANQMVSGGNYTLVTNTLSWMCDNTSAVSIPVKDMSVSYLTVPSASAGLWGTLTIAVIPAGVLAAGLIVWNRRRKK